MRERPDGDRLPRLPRKARIILIALLGLGTAALAAALEGPGADWSAAFLRSYAEAAGQSSYVPSPLASRLAMAAAEGRLASLAPEEAARLAFDAAVDADRSLRFGATIQDASAETRQSLAISSRQERGKKFLADLRKAQKAPPPGLSKKAGKAHAPQGKNKTE